MKTKITVKIVPLPQYIKYERNSYTLCGIEFVFDCDGELRSFRSESSDTCIRELMSEIDDYLMGVWKTDTPLCYYIPWIAGNFCVYPYSFLACPAKDTWEFRYKRNQNDAKYEFVCELTRRDVISLRSQLAEQYAALDWQEQGKTELWQIVLQERPRNICYSAKELADVLDAHCRGKQIKAMFVSANNYEDPLRVEENFVNYYVGEKLFIQLEDSLVDLRIHAQGLFECRVFRKDEFRLEGPISKCIEDGNNELCMLGNVYGMFTVPYIDVDIQRVKVEAIGYLLWQLKGFDKSKLGDPVELPSVIYLELENGYTLSLHGWDDDFAIKLQPTMN